MCFDLAHHASHCVRVYHCRVHRALTQCTCPACYYCRQLKVLTVVKQPVTKVTAAVVPVTSQLGKLRVPSITLDQFIKGARAGARRKRKHTELKRSGVLEVCLYILKPPSPICLCCQQHLSLAMAVLTPKPLAVATEAAGGGEKGRRRRRRGSRKEQGAAPRVSTLGREHESGRTCRQVGYGSAAAHPSRTGRA